MKRERESAYGGFSTASGKKIKISNENNPDLLKESNKHNF